MCFPLLETGMTLVFLFLRREAQSWDCRSYSSKLHVFRIFPNESVSQGSLFSVEVTVICGSLNLGVEFCKQKENISSLEASKIILCPQVNPLFPQQRKSRWFCSHPFMVSKSDFFLICVARLKFRGFKRGRESYLMLKGEWERQTLIKTYLIAWDGKRIDRCLRKKIDQIQGIY